MGWDWYNIGLVVVWGCVGFVWFWLIVLRVLVCGLWVLVCVGVLFCVVLLFCFLCFGYE